MAGEVQVEQPTLLKALLVERHWQKFETFCHEYKAVAARVGRRLVTSSPSREQFHRWINGKLKTSPHPDHCLVLSRMFPSYTITELFSPPSATMEVDRCPAVSPVAGETVGEDAGGRAPRRRDGWTERELVIAAAHQSADHAREIEEVMVSPTTLDDLQHGVARLARTYHGRAPAYMLGEALRVRGRVYRLLQRTRRPDQLADLYVVAGQTCGLMASASFDLGYVDAATEQAQAAYLYGEVAGHPGLRAWSRGLQAEAAYWTGRPREAVRIVDCALHYAPPGAARVRLHCIRGRAWAYMRYAAEVNQAVHAAEDARSAAETDDLNAMGGHFAFDRARQARCNTTSYVQLGAGTEAEQHADIALRLYREAPSGEAWRLIELEIVSDLASARLLARDVDGANDALERLWDLPPDQRREGLNSRINRTRSLLEQPAVRNVPIASELAERIEDFVAASIVRALPRGTT